MRRFLALLMVVLPAPVLAADVTYQRLDPATVEHRLKPVPKTAADRLRALKALYVEGGIEPNQLLEQRTADEALPSLICTVPGKGKGTIIVTAPLDFPERGDDAAVQWATLAMLPLMAESIAAAPHERTFVFIAFSGQRNGFTGSLGYVRQMTDTQRASIVAVFALDHLGRTPLGYVYADRPVRRESNPVTTPMNGRTSLTSLPAIPVNSNSANWVRSVDNPDTLPARCLKGAATGLQFQQPQESHEGPSTDSKSFLNAGIDALTVFSQPFRTLDRTDGTIMRMVKADLDMQVYYETYQLLCVGTLLLDRCIQAEQAATKPAVIQK